MHYMARYNYHNEFKINVMNKYNTRPARKNKYVCPNVSK